VLIDPDFIKNVKELVLAAMNFDMTGPEKKQAVLQELKDIGGAMADTLADTSTFILSLAVDIVVAYLKSRADEA